MTAFGLDLPRVGEWVEAKSRAGGTVTNVVQDVYPGLAPSIKVDDKWRDSVFHGWKWRVVPKPVDPLEERAQAARVWGLLIVSDVYSGRSQDVQDVGRLALWALDQPGWRDALDGET